MADVLPDYILRLGGSSDIQTELLISSSEFEPFEGIVAEGPDSSQEAGLVDMIDHCFGVIDFEGDENCCYLLVGLVFKKVLDFFTELQYFLNPSFW